MVEKVGSEENPGGKDTLLSKLDIKMKHSHNDEKFVC